MVSRFLLCVLAALAGGMCWTLVDSAAQDRAIDAQESAPLGQTADQRAAESPASAEIDPAAWGSDHVGQPLPAYMESGECLFCHRHTVGGSWGRNKHNRTIRDAAAAEPAIEALRRDPRAAATADEVDYLLGDTRAQRYLRKSPEYGRVEVLSCAAHFGRGSRPRLHNADNPQWDKEKFAERCAGCHATAVNPRTAAFSAVAHDCYVCHGDATEEHAVDPALMPLANERRDPPRAVIAICAQCHVRFGKSRSSGRPYPNNFVAGDNLFRDFAVDWKQADNAELNPADRHVMENVRDVALLGREETTCLTCHEVHSGSTAAHRKLARTAYCNHCHAPDRPLTEHIRYDVHSELCEY